jgi:PLP dependent protein
MSISSNIKRVEEMIRQAALKAHRDPAEITLVGVSKTVGPAGVREAYASGLKNFGENRLQDAMEKVAACPPDITWHFIGHVQTNKVKALLPHFALIHSLDRFKLAERFSSLAVEAKREVKALVQVNIAGEASKQGLSPGETREFIGDAAGLPNLQILGLMAMAPFVEDPKEVRPYFKQMKTLFDSIRVPGAPMRYLSMGMSGDFTVAVEEGANIIRVGSLIFQTAIND